MRPESPIRALFEPASIAVIGASRSPGKVGHQALKNIIDAGYRGRIIPVNPEAREILGQACARHVDDLPAVDLAIICLPRDKVLDTVEALAHKHVPAAVVVSTGFKESGREGYLLEERLRAVAKAADMALLGPGSLGLASPEHRLNATILPDAPLAGNIGFFSQSGAFCTAMLDVFTAEGLGFSKFLSLGNEAVVDETAAITALGEDPGTKVIVGYLESVDEGQRFRRAAEKTTAKKPVVLLKAGSSPSGARAVTNHTGSQAGYPPAYASALKQSGVLQVDDVESLMALARAFSEQPLPTGPNLCVVTNSGGPGILTADACENSRLHLVRPGPEAVEKLREALPPYASLYNPIDIIGDAGAERYRTTMDIVVEDEMTHALLVLLTPTASVEIEATAKAVIEVSRNTPKPVVASFMGGERVGPGVELLRSQGVPCFDFPEQAVQAVEAMYLQRLWKDRQFPVEVCFRRDIGRAEKALNRARDLGLEEIHGTEAVDVAQAYELPVLETVLARTSDRAVRAAGRMGYPVALKLFSPAYPEPADSGMEVAGIEDAAALRRAFLELTSRAVRERPGAYVAGCLVQAMPRSGGLHCVIGFDRDPQFGPLLFFGLGGPAMAVLNDVSRRLAPLTLGDAQSMVRDIQAFPLLKGARGGKPVDLGAIEDILLTLSQLALDFPEIHQLTLDPVHADGEGAQIAGVRLTAT